MVKFDRLTFFFTVLFSPCSQILVFLFFPLQNHFQFISTSIIQFTEPAICIRWFWRIVDVAGYFPAVQCISWIITISHLHAMLLVSWRQDER